MPRLLSLLVCGVVLLSAPALPQSRAEVQESRIAQLFAPGIGERMLLSPNGRYIMYTQHEQDVLKIVVMETERFRVITRIEADDDRPIMHSKEKRRVNLRFLGWSGSNRIVFAPSTEVIAAPVAGPRPDMLAGAGAEVRELANMPRPGAKILAPIQSVNPDGTDPRTLADASTFEVVGGESRVPEILGFAPGDRESLLLELRGRLATQTSTEVVRLDIRSGKWESLSRETPGRFYHYDQQGRPRLVREQSNVRDEYDFLYRPLESSKWQPLGSSDKGSTPTPPVFGYTLKSYFSPRAFPLGFDFDPNVLIYASNEEQDTFGLFGLNLATRQRTALALVQPGRDVVTLNTSMPNSALVFDEHRQALAGVRSRGSRLTTLWVDAELAGIQRTLDAGFPQRIAQIINWDDARTRFLVHVSGGTEPGRNYLYKPAEKVSIELLRRLPGLPNADLHDTRYFDFESTDGAHLTGHLTLPRKPRLTPTPLIVWFATGLPLQPHPSFDPQVQVLADMGFIVCRLNQRGVAGLGRAHSDGLRRDLSGAPAADALAALEWVASQHKVDRQRVVTWGEGLAGQFAVRTLQLHPEAFRCAVALEPVFNLTAWTEAPADSARMSSFPELVNRFFLEGLGANLAREAATSHVAQQEGAVFMTSYDAPMGHRQQVSAGDVSELRSKMKRRSLPITVVEVDRDYLSRQPKARTRVYRELEEFFNLNLYSPNVKIGPTRVVK